VIEVGGTTREGLLAALAGAIEARRAGEVLRVAIDGPDAAGKTTLADDLAARVRSGASGEVERAGIDDFLRPREIRYRRGPLSPEGCYRDTFDLDAVRRAVLASAGPVLVFDGVFLLRPELRDLWDLSVFVGVAPEETVRRALVRDAGLMGGEEGVRERYARRYLPAQELYRAEADPVGVADVVLGNDDPGHPTVVRWVSSAR
jgi:uridine kinase